jgi:hypothetical protein
MFVAMVLLVGAGCLLRMVGDVGTLALDLAERIANRMEA